MRIDIRFDNGAERLMALLVVLLVLSAVFFAGSVLSPTEARAEWNSEGSFGDSYYLRNISETLDHNSDIFYDIYLTLDALESKLNF
jgi:hypothetical protein